MQTIRIAIAIEPLSQPGQIEEIADTVVDTGSLFTWIPRSVLESLGIRPERRERVIAADGQSVERQLGFAIVHAARAATADIVVFAEEHDSVLLGARSLGGLNLRVDVGQQKLVDAGPILAVALTHS